MAKDTRHPVEKEIDLIERRFLTKQAKSQRVLLFEKENLIQEKQDLYYLAKLAREGFDLEYIHDQMDHLTMKELILMALHLCYTGRIKRFLLSWDIE